MTNAGPRLSALACLAVVILVAGRGSAQTPSPSPSRVPLRGFGWVSAEVGFGKAGPGFKPEPRFPFPESLTTFTMRDVVYSYVVAEHPRLAANVPLTVSVRWLRAEKEIHQFSQSYTALAGYASQWAWSGLPPEKMAPGSHAAEWSMNGVVVGKGVFTVRN